MTLFRKQPSLGSPGSALLGGDGVGAHPQSFSSPPTRRYITETLDQSKYLLSILLQQGNGAFLTAWQRYSTLLSDTYGSNPQEIDRRLMALASGFMAILFQGRTESIIRGQLQMSDAFIHESNLDRKFSRFIEAVTPFIEQQISSSRELSLPARVSAYLKNCDLRELKGLTVPALARQFDYHPDHFTKKIKSETGSLPSDLIATEKLRRASLLIKDKSGQKNLREISLSVGFQDYAHFRELVKRHLGMLPSQL